jgi:hypothetical protein
MAAIQTQQQMIQQGLPTPDWLGALVTAQYLSMLMQARNCIPETKFTVYKAEVTLHIAFPKIHP